MKKLLSVFISICILMSSLSTVCAISLDERNLSQEEFFEERNLNYNEILEKPNSIIFNEFDGISNLDKSDKHDEKSMFSNKHDKNNYKYEFKKQLSELAKEKEEDLIKHGINKERARYIKSLENIPPEEITDNQARKASSKLSFVLEKNWHHGKRASFICYWAWDSAPYTASNDVLAFAWTMGYIVDLDETTMRVEYEDMYGDYEGSKRFDPIGKINGCGFIFPQSYRSPAFRGLSSGKAFVVVKNMEDKDYLEVNGEYGHSYVRAVPGFSIEGMSISFNTGISSENYDYIQWDEI